LTFRGHERGVVGRVVLLLAALLTVVLSLGAWTALEVTEHDAGAGIENNAWRLVGRRIGEYRPSRDRTQPKGTQLSPSQSCAQGDNDGGRCGDPTRMPEPITLLLFGAMLSGLGVVVRWGLRGPPELAADRPGSPNRR